MLKFNYNAPTTLTFSFVALAAYIMGIATSGQSTMLFFSLHGDASFFNATTYFLIFSHAIGHASWDHLLGNFSFILLLGPILEEKYGSINILFMCIATAALTGIANIILFHNGVLGASGVVFMFILLSSLANIQSGRIPLTFVLIVFLFLGKELYNGFFSDNISQFSHIFGGICGSVFGFILNKPHSPSSLVQND